MLTTPFSEWLASLFRMKGFVILVLSQSSSPSQQGFRAVALVTFQVLCSMFLSSEFSLGLKGVRISAATIVTQHSQARSSDDDYKVIHRNELMQLWRWFVQYDGITLRLNGKNENCIWYGLCLDMNTICMHFTFVVWHFRVKINDNLSVYPSIIELVLLFKKLINHNFCNHILIYIYIVTMLHRISKLI